MKTPIIQFGTSRFLQAHADLFVDESLKNNNAGGHITVVQTTNNKERFNRLKFLSKGYPVHIKGFKNKVLIDEIKNINSIGRAFSTYKNWKEIEKIFINEVKFVFSNTGDTGFITNISDHKVAYDQSKSYPGKLLDLLYARYKNNANPITIFPLELIRKNGKTIKNITINLAKNRKLEKEFISWIENKIIWVNSLVDRIVSEPIEPVGAVTEPYALWAIENQPRLVLPCQHECISVVSNLEPYERLKLHILNLGHTVLANKWKKEKRPLNESVAEILNNNEILKYLNKIYYNEVIPVFKYYGLEDEAIKYVETTIERFKNPFLKHLLGDIIQNHHEKVSRRIVEFFRWSESKTKKLDFHELKKIV